MPGICLHRELAHSLCDREAFRRTATFSFDNPATWQAFLAGSVGPDMGVFPGAVGLVSDLAHYVRSGQLCRAMVTASKTDTQRAYAWGWVAHCLADRLMHPLINRGVGALLHGDCNCEVAYAANPEAHVRVELGLDAYWLARSSRSGPPTDSNKRLVDPEMLDPLYAAFEEVYLGIDLRSAITRSYRASIRWFRSWFCLAAFHGQRLGLLPSSVWRSVLAEACLLSGRVATFALSSRAGLRGMFRAVQPPAWLCNDSERLSAIFVDEFLGQIALGLPDMPDYNLDTGYVEDPTAPYPLTIQTLQTYSRLVSDAKYRTRSTESE